MQHLVEQSDGLLEDTEQVFVRYLSSQIDFNDRLILIKGARGCGKTTLLLQHAKKQSKALNGKTLYVSLDNVYFYENKLFQLIKDFRMQGGKLMILDEVHKYPNWSTEIKNAYDTYSDIKIIFTGSSALQLNKAQADLSRRAAQYTLWGLSFREFLNFSAGFNFSAYTLEELLSNHTEIAKKINKQIRPLAYFYNYLNYGYFPYFNESKQTYHAKLLSTINLIIESDLPAIQNIDYGSGLKLKRLFYQLSRNCPYKPNVQKLSQEIGATRGTLLQYMDYLNDAQLINLLKTKAGSLSYLTKPDKVYLANTNLMYALGGTQTDLGSARECFFYNQLNSIAEVNYTPKGDFLVNNKYIFEVGGENKSFNQIKDIKNSYLALDKTELGSKNRIPLWLFGFLY